MGVQKATVVPYLLHIMARRFSSNAYLPEKYRNGYAIDRKRMEGRNTLVKQKPIIKTATVHYKNVVLEDVQGIFKTFLTGEKFVEEMVKPEENYRHVVNRYRGNIHIQSKTYYGWDRGSEIHSLQVFDAPIWKYVEYIEKSRPNGLKWKTNPDQVKDLKAISDLKHRQTNREWRLGITRREFYSGVHRSLSQQYQLLQCKKKVNWSKIRSDCQLYSNSSEIQIRRVSFKTSCFYVLPSKTGKLKEISDSHEKILAGNRIYTAPQISAPIA